MKITCNSCGSKYTIADAKVQGKKVKVRCKGCKESILVDGTKIGEGGGDDAGSDDAGADDEAPVEEAPAKAPAAPPAAAQASAGADDEPKKDKDLWSVNLSDEDSRDMTVDELVAGWKDGTVTSDAYVWKDGMGDWKPILEVGELKLKLGAAKKKAGGVVSSTGAAAAGAAAATAGGDGKMDDLFGGGDDAVNAPSEVELPAGDGDEKPTGARNDSSVLFSLDSLNTGGDAPDGPKKNSGDDLFAGLGASGPSLQGNADLLTAPAKDPPPAPAGNRAQPAAAPVAESKGGGKGVMIAGILGVAIILGGGLFAFGMGGGEEEKKDAKAEDSGESDAAKAAAEEAQKKLDEKMAKLEKMEAELKKAKEEAVKKGEDPEEAAKKKKEELEKEKAEAEKKEAASAGKDSGSSSGSKPAASSGSETKKKDSGSSSSGGAAKFDVGAAKAALSAAAANAAACKKPGGPTGSGKVQVTFSTSGRVTSSTVISGPFGGTAVGGCVASTFRRARVPKFSGSPKTVAKSFRIN